MAHFLLAYQRTNRHEGGFVDHPFDRGGMTYRGIARRIWPDWEGWAVVDRIIAQGQTPPDIHPLLERLHEQFFERHFWQAAGLDALPDSMQTVAEEVYDSAVNVGVVTACRWLQRGVNALNNIERAWPDIDEDGQIGPDTRSALESCARAGWIPQLVKLLNVQQGASYLDIVRRDESQEVFMRGWLSRVSL